MSRRIPQDVRQQIYEDLKKGLKRVDIAAERNVSEISVTRIARENKLPRKQTKGWTTREIAWLFTLRHAGKVFREIGEEMGRTEPSVRGAYTYYTYYGSRDKKRQPK